MESGKREANLPKTAAAAYGVDVEAYCVYADGGLIDNLFGFEERREWSLNDLKTWRRIEEVLSSEGKNGLKVLDAGSGPCAWSLRILHRFPEAELVALDICEEFVQKGRRLAEQMGYSERLTLRVGDVQNLPFRDREFDVTLCLHDVLNHCPDAPRAIAELHRVTRSTVITSVHAIHGDRTCYVRPMDEITSYEQSGDILRFSDRYGRPYELYSHLFNRAELLNLVAGVARIEECLGLDIFAHRFLTSAGSVPGCVEALEHMMEAHPELVDYASHIMVISHPI